MRVRLVLIGRNLVALSELALHLNDFEFVKTIVESPRPVDELIVQHEDFDAAIVHFSGHENIGDLASLFSSHPQQRFLFLTDHWPPSAAVARMISRHNGRIEQGSAEPVIIVATLITQLAKVSA